MVIAFAQPRMGSLEVMKSRSPGQEKCGSLRGMNVQAGVCSAEDSGPGSQDHGEPCWGPGLCPFRGPEAKLSGCMVQFGAWFQILPSWAPSQLSLMGRAVPGASTGLCMLSPPSSPACPTIISRMGRTKVHPWPQFPVFPFPSSWSVQ